MSYDNSKEEKFFEDKEIPQEVRDKLKSIKNNLDKFKDEILKKFEKLIIGIALLPPDKEAKKEDKDNINVFVLIDDSAENFRMRVEEIKTKLFDPIEKIAKDTNKNLAPQPMFLSELKESCFDGKYEILQLIGMSAIIHDRGMLSALKVSEIHKTMSIKKFEKYVLSYVAVGSLFRSDANPNDIDVFVVIDDTDVKKMPRVELKDKLRSIIQGMGAEAAQIAGIKANFHVQTYILTDFWDSVKDANPVIFTFLRDGVPLYDRGVFMPWKLLLKMGRVKPSPEAIDMNMDIGERLLERTRQKLLSVVGEDLYYATLNTAQAALMLYGIPPTTPKETVTMMEEVFVKKEKLLEKKYIDILESIRKYYKDVEHNKLKDISGVEVDKLLKETDLYLKRIKKLFVEIEKRAQTKNIIEAYDAVILLARDALYMLGVKDVNINQLERIFKEHLVDTGKIPDKFFRILKVVMKAKDSYYRKKKPSKQEIEMMKKDVGSYLKYLSEFIQRSRGIEIERAKIRFKYGHNKFGEVLLLDKIAFLTENLEKREDVNKADIVNGCLRNIKKSSIEELEKELQNAKIPPRAFIKEAIFEDLRKLFGNEVEICVSY